MNIIRDEETGIGMLPLLLSWGVHRCNITGCSNKPTTIISGVPETPVFGMCENHYQEAIATKGKYKFSLDFSKQQ